MNIIQSSLIHSVVDGLSQVINIFGSDSSHADAAIGDQVDMPFFD